jgi:hypothetical protein
VEVEVEAEAEAEAEEENDQCRKLREQNEVTERGGLGAHRGRGLYCLGAGKAFFGGRARGLLVWGGGRAGRQAGRRGRLAVGSFGCSQEQARSCSTGVEKCRPTVPVSHRPSSKPASEHPIPSPLDSRKRARRGGIRDLLLVFCRRGQGTIRSSSCKTKARCELCCCKSRMKERSAAQRRGEQRKAERKPG